MQELNITPCVLKRFSRIKNIADKIINYTIICSVIHPPPIPSSAGHEVKRRQKYHFQMFDDLQSCKVFRNAI